MDLLFSILGIIVTIFFVVGTHEFAHFYVARLLNVKVLRFSIGFGKAFYRWYDKRGTEYVLAWIPLGGYVKMLDESEGDVPANERHLAFNNQPFYKKFLIVFAGPATNMLCAFILYWLIFTIGFTTVKPVIGSVTPNSIAAAAGLKSNQVITKVDNQTTLSWRGVVLRLLVHMGDRGELPIETTLNQKAQHHLLNLNDWKLDELKPDPFASLGLIPYEPDLPMIIGIIAPESPAYHAGLQLGDKIIRLNHVKVTDWESFTKTIYLNPSQHMTLTILRDGKELSIPIDVGAKRFRLYQHYGWLGIGPKFSWPDSMLSEIKYTPFDALFVAGNEVINFTQLNVVLFGKMIIGKLSLKSLGGPITIFESAGDALNAGYIAFLGFLAFLSISIGIINFLPIPGLDGGHLLFQIIEAIIRKPIPDRVLLVLFRLGFLFLIFILIQALINDILRL